MTDTPNRPPLWWAMSDACADHPRGVVDLHPAAVAAQIRALRNWLIKECRIEEIDQDARNSIYKMLTTEADRAERGDG